MSRGANLHGIPTPPLDTPTQSQTLGNQPGLVLPDQLGPDQALPIAPSPVPPPPASEGLDLPDKKSALEDVYNSVQKTDPDRAAKIFQLQQKLDQPLAYLDKNLDQVQKAAAAPGGSFFKQLDEQYPGTAQFLSDPKNMAVTHDDLDNLPLTEKIVNAAKDAFSFEKSAFQSGALQEELGMTRYQQIEGQPVQDTDLFRMGHGVASELGVTATDPNERAQQIADKLSELEKNQPQSGILKKGLYGATQFVPQILGGLAYGAKFGAPAAAGAALLTGWSGPGAGAAAAGAGEAGMTAGEVQYNYRLMTGLSYDSLLKLKDVNGNPLPDSTAKIAAQAMGAATAGLSLVKLGAVLDTIPGGKDFLAKFTAEAGEKVLSDPKSYGQALKSFAQNYVTSVVHGVGAMEGITAVNLAGTEAAKAASGQKFDHPSSSDVLAEFGHTAEDAAATFGVMAIPGLSMGMARDMMDARKVQQSQAVYQAIGKVAESSKLRERMPEAHQQFISSLAKGSPIENVYIPVEAAQNYFQSKSIDPAQAMAELGASKSFEEAQSTGGDIKIPLSTWTDKIVGTEHYQGLAKDIKFDPEDMTAREVETRQADIQDQVQKLVAQQKEEEAQAGQKEAVMGKLGQAGEIAKRIQEQLKAAGVSAPEAEFSPQLHEAFFNTLGKHLGVEPTDLMDRFPLKIGSAEDQANPGQDVQTEAAPEAIAAQPAYKPEVLNQIRDDIDQGKVEKGNVQRDAEGNVTGRYGAVSSYPEYFQNKGYSKKETLRAIDKHLAGENLTEKQSKIVDDLYRSSGYDKDAKRVQAQAEPFLQGPKDLKTGEKIAPGTGIDTAGQLSDTKVVPEPSEIEQLRKRVSDLETELRTSEKTGLRNNKAFTEDESLGWVGVGALDMDGLKRLNDHIGHDAADRVLKELGGALLKAQGEGDEVRFYHRSGDEFAARFKNPEDAEKTMADIQRKLEAAKVRVTVNGKEYEIKGIGISYGTGDNYERADQRASDQKRERLAAGLREDARSGNQSRRVSEVTDSSGGKSGGETPQSGGGVLEQGAPKLAEVGPRGRIRIGREGYAIDLFKSADRSTFLHETGHYFLDVMGHIAEDEKAPQQVKDDYQTILKWLGVNSSSEIGTDQHEKFARGFEAYLMEGKAPSSSLQRAFDRFRKWLASVYKHVKNLNVDLSDDVRGVMDRMLASEEQVERAQHAIGYRGEEIPGVPVDVQAKIHDLQMKARDEAETHLMKEQMSELGEKHKEFLASEKIRLQNVAKDQVSEMPLYKAMDEAVATIGKDRQAGTIAEKFLSEKLKPEESAKFEALAEVHGFTDGEDMAKQMILAEEGNLRAQEIQSRVEAGMAPHQDLMNSDRMRAEALSAVHGEKMTELLALERETLSRLANKASVSQELSKRKRLEAKVEAEAAKQRAREILSDKPVKEATKSQPYVTAERNAAVKAAKALAKKDYEAASEAKRQQMLNHAIAAEAMRNKTFADKAIDFLKDYSNRKNDLKDMPYGFTRQIDQMLSNAGFSEQRTEDFPTLTAIAKDMAAKKEDPIEIANRTGFVQDESGNWKPESLSDFVERVNENYYALSLPDSVMSGTAKNFEDLNLGELRELRNSVKAISDIGKKYDRFLGEFKQADMKVAAAEFRKSVEENYGAKYADDLAPGSKHETKLGELLSPIAKVPDVFNRMLDTILTTCHKLDGLKEGPAKEFIYRPFEEAESREVSRTAEAMKEVEGIFAKHYDLDEFGKYKDTRINVEGRFFTKDQILAMALNWGNEANRQRLMDGFGFDEAKMQRVFKNLGKNDWEFCQDTWNHLEKYWPEIAKLEMEVNGAEPGKVEAAPFSNEHGSFQGGYYPIAYDFDKSSDAFKNAQSKDALFKQFSTAAAHTDQGHAKARVRQVNRPISLDLSVLKAHHQDVIHDLEFRRAVIDVSRFLNQRDSKAALTNALGVRGYAGISDWLKAAAGGGGEPMNAFDKAARWFRFKTVFFNLGYRLISAPKIAIENMVNVASELGIPDALRSVKDYYLDRSNLHQMVLDKSTYMEQRGKHLDRDLSDLMNKWQGTEPSAPMKHFHAYAFYVHAFMDQAVSFPLWSHIYNQGIAEHGDEKLAVNQADESVKRTFMSGGKIDQAAIMRGGERIKALTTAYGYQSMMWNRFSMQRFEAGQALDKGNYMHAAAIAARATVYTFMLPAVTAALTREYLRNNQTTSSDDQKKRIAASLLEESSPLKFIPVLRDMSAYEIKRALGQKEGDLQLTPLEGALETILGIGGDSLHALAGGKVGSKYPEQVVNSVSLAAGVPKQVDDMVFNFMDWQQNHGEASWRDFISRRTKR